MQIKRKWLNLFIIISLIFLIYSLASNNYLFIPVINSYYLIIMSFLLLFIGFVIQGLSWRITLRAYGFNINRINSITSFGSSVFGKYIPGKIWTIMGKASLINSEYGYPINKLLTISLNSQFITLWVGLLLGLIGLFFISLHIYISIILILGWLFLSLIIFNDGMHGIFNKIFYKLFKKHINIPTINIKKTIQLLPVYFLFWILFAISFYFLVSSISVDFINISIIFAFPLAGTIGILMVFAPGGIGVREGLLVTYLTLAGLSTEFSLTVSLLSRLWFLIGEAFIFLLSILLVRWYEKK